MHWNEGFSSLQHEGHKNFLRMKINKEGALELYAIGVDKVPLKWELDDQHVKAVKSGERMAHVSNPSRWKPKRTIRKRLHPKNSRSYSNKLKKCFVDNKMHKKG